MTVSYQCSVSSMMSTYRNQRLNALQRQHLPWGLLSDYITHAAPVAPEKKLSVPSDQAAQQILVFG